MTGTSTRSPVNGSGESTDTGERLRVKCESIDRCGHFEAGRAMESKAPVFPISVRFEDGEVEEYNDVEELVTGLEDFDSDIDTACEVRDHLGRPLRLKLKLQELKDLSVV